MESQMLCIVDCHETLRVSRNDKVVIYCVFLAMAEWRAFVIARLDEVKAWQSKSVDCFGFFKASQ
ncbi:MAG: hypothetical protein PUB96_08585 [Helicobacteraceae bacterium]|nr:hypothetical protein [Helicobacteraceae bacterium]